MIYSHYSEYMSRSMSAARPGPDPGELEFLSTYLDSCEEPFLELACGYGRLLLPILERGHRIVGTDASPEMLERCRSISHERGFAPELHEQFMQRLELDEQFGFIFIDDCTFALVVTDEDAHELFTRVFNHLKPGGTFLFDFFAVDPDEPASRGQVTMGWTQADDGSIFVGRKISSYDPETHVTTRLQIHDLYVNGVFAGSQAYPDPNRDYHPEVVTGWLEEHGFTEIELGGYHTDGPPTPGDAMLSVRCRRPE
jgi:SAM-dependent methyltransferase